MKPIALGALILLSLFVLTSTPARADAVLVGSLDLTNAIPGPNGLDSLTFTNVTGWGAPNTPDQALTVWDVTLDVNGVDETASFNGNANTLAGLFYELDNLPQDSINSLSLTASVLPMIVTVNGQTETLSGVNFSWSGSPLDTSVGPQHFDIDVAGTVPEPASLLLLGASLGTIGLLRRFRTKA